MSDLFKEIDLLIRSRYPILYIVTWEEERAIADVRRVAKSRNRDAYVWSYADVLLKGPDDREQEIEALQAIGELLKSKDDVIYVFYDFHTFLEGRNDRVIRKLREFATTVSRLGEKKTVIIISPVLTIPVELAKVITVIDYPLPGMAELGTVLDGVTGALAGDPLYTVSLDEPGREKVLKAALGLTLGEAERVFSKAVEKDRSFSEKHVAVILEEKKQVIRKSGMLEYISAQEDFQDVGGLAELKNWLRTRRDAFTDEARAFGLPEPRGVLLIGVPGCGKSLCAKAIASEWDKPLLRLEVGSLFSSYVGSSESNMRRAIAIAESVSPAILWIDEIEKGFAGIRGGESDSGTAGRVFGTFVTWMQEKTKPVFVVATANDISRLPPELLRKGRFDEIFFVDLPDEAERQGIFEIHLRRHLGVQRYEEQMKRKLDLKELSRLTDSFSGAEIEQVVVAGLYEAFARRAEERVLRLDPHLRQSIREIVPLARTMSGTVEGLRKWALTRSRPASSQSFQVGAAAPSARVDHCARMRMPFAFDDSSKAETLEELLRAAESRRDEIRRDLYNARLENWLRQNGLEPVARETRRIRQESANEEYGIDSFLTVLARYIQDASSQ